MTKGVPGYMRACASGVRLVLATTTLGTIIRAEGAVKEGMVGNLAATAVNMILDPLFILGLDMGVAGAAVATVLGNFAGTLYYLHFIAKKAVVLNTDIRLAKENGKALCTVIALGMPNALSSILSGFASTFSNRLLGSYGTDAIAAMAAAGKTAMIIGMLQMGICMGVQPLLAYNYGAKNVPRLRETIRNVAILTAAAGTVTGILCFVLREPIIGMFLKEPDVAGMGVAMTPYLVAASPVIGLYYLSTNFVQSAGNAFSATLMSVLRQGVLLIPFLYLLHAAMGQNGIAAAHTVADILSVGIGVLLMWRQYRLLKAETE